MNAELQRPSLTPDNTFCCFAGLDSTKQVNLFVDYFNNTTKQLNRKRETGGQLYSDTSRYKVSEYSLQSPRYKNKQTFARLSINQ